jgi:hypothetical protein
MDDPVYVKLQDPFKSSTNSKQKSFRLENPGFLIPRSPVFPKNLACFPRVGQRWSGFLDFVDPQLRFGGEGGGGFVNWEPTAMYTYTRPKNRKTPPSH